MTRLSLVGLIALSVLSLAACSSDDDDQAANETSQLNEDLNTPDNAGQPGGDTSAIAGLWDGTLNDDAGSDVLYWNLEANGVLTQYDYQQDGAPGASGENCYIVGDPITVTPENADEYSIANVAVTAVRSGDVLTIVFSEPDANDLDGDGDTTETPTLNWPLFITSSFPDLNACS